MRTQCVDETNVLEVMGTWVLCVFSRKNNKHTQTWYSITSRPGAVVA